MDDTILHLTQHCPIMKLSKIMKYNYYCICTNVFKVHNWLLYISECMENLSLLSLLQKMVAIFNACRVFFTLHIIIRKKNLLHVSFYRLSLPKNKIITTIVICC